MKRREFMKVSALTAVALANPNLFAATTATNLVPNLTLNNEVAMPILGFGTSRLKGKEGQKAIETAFEVGYRMIDSAAIYGNEDVLGAAFRASGLKREEVFITTKIWSDIGKESVLKGINDSLERLKFDYVDLYLLHHHAGDETLGAWESMQKLYKEGLSRAIGVSNFSAAQVHEICEKFETKPALNQIKLNPYIQETALQKVHKELNVATQSYSSLGGQRGGTEVLKDPVLTAIAQKHGKTSAQIILRWLAQQLIITIPKTSNKSRMIENLSIFDFKLDGDDLSKIASLDR